MKSKSIESVSAPPPAHMVGDGFKVHNFFPGRLPMERMSPFFLMDYGPKTRIAPSETPRGVGAHPHRGFETVTLAFHGRVAHHDSAGNSGIIGEGDVQWMTAGSGILHKEYHEKEFSRSGGIMQMVQLWVNLPARDKMTAPRYQEIKHADMGVYDLPQGQGRVEVVAGEYRGAKGPAKTHTPVQLYKARLATGAEWDLEFPAEHNSALLVIEGAVEANGKAVPENHFALFANEGESIRIRATADSRVLVLSGEPIDEPIAAYGPFVMNTQEEIYRAVEDFQTGKFGRLD
jgi:redox-sensitive bicupin YhaK (pirin superfamily)